MVNLESTARIQLHSHFSLRKILLYGIAFVVGGPIIKPDSEVPLPISAHPPL